MKSDLSLLAGVKSWQLHKISSTTAPGDVVCRVSKDMSNEEITAMIALLRKRNAYRCRIGKARWYFGETAKDAIEAALKGRKK